jgi:V/A-type H+-transporting ATPase subunit I
MRFVNIMGRIDDIDRVIDNYITHYDIHLEHALKDMLNAEGLQAFTEVNPYPEYIQMGERFAKSTGLDLSGRYKRIDSDTAVKIITDASHFYEKRDRNLKSLEEERQNLAEFIEKWEPFVSLEFDIVKLKSFEFIEYRFGKMPINNYKQFEAYVYSQNDILFVESERDSKYLYGVYFVPTYTKDRVDTVLTTLNFERVFIPFEMGGSGLFGTPEKVLNMLNARVFEIEKDISAQRAETLFSFGINNDDVIDAYNTLKEVSYNFELRSFAARTHSAYYVFIGWMSERDARAFEKEVENDGKIILVLEGSEGRGSSVPPTKLKNNPLVKPFEFFVKMYGLPRYDEIDPTPFVALTYFILFGVMFGDLGQGFCLSLIGFALYKFKGMELGKIMGLIGISSMFFGLMYGSVFGLEDLIPAIWMRPAENINPLLNINEILIISVGAGVLLIFIAMVFNMINALRQKDFVRLILGPNGLCGMIFYGAVLGIGLAVALGHIQVAAWLIVVFIGTPLIIIAFKEPIGSFLINKKAKIEGSIPMFLLETVIELFEVLLTYFTNTVSFVRVGAFALSHAGMMSVVLLMAGAEAGTHNPVVMVLGNILVMVMEGLVVGIQVLRIEFYELFSRYYEGGGREFTPIKNSRD